MVFQKRWRVPRHSSQSPTGQPPADRRTAPRMRSRLTILCCKRNANNWLRNSVFRPRLTRSPLEFGDTVPRFGPLTGREKKLLARAAAADAARFADAVTSFREEESSVEEYYRSVPEEPQPEAPEQPMIALPPLSTALSRHGQVPLQLQNAKATTGLSTGAGPLIAATAADPHPARGHDPGNAKAIMAASGGV